MANLAILRVAKIKTMSSLAVRGKHTFRERETPNADAERTPLNQIVGAKSTDDLMQKVSDLLPTKRRKDAVIGLEYLITASPEHFGQDWQKSKSFGVEYFKDAIAWLEKRHGKGNVVCATLHLDESTPHLAAFVVPRTADGRLSSKDFIGGASTLSKMQTDFAAQVGKKHGLERGVEWSKAVHKPNAAIAPMTAERLDLRRQVKELTAEVERLIKRVGSDAATLAAAQKALADAQAKAKATSIRLDEASQATATAKAESKALAAEKVKLEKRSERQQKLNVENFHLINKLEAENATLTKDMQMSTEMNHQLVAEIATLRAENESALDQQKERDEFAARCEGLAEAKHDDMKHGTLVATFEGRSIYKAGRTLVQGPAPVNPGQATSLGVRR